MIEIKSLASGSSGNCYWISDGSSPLLLEAGISFREIQKGIDFKAAELEGCLISHEHGDHAKAVAKLTRAGVDCYMSPGTAEAIGIHNHRITPVPAGAKIDLGSWVVRTFQVEHDAEGPLGFFLANQSGGRLLYISDSFYSRYTFRELTHIMIECNYAKDILDENVKYGRVSPARKKRVLQSHFSLKNVKEFLRANDLSQLQEIHLLHLSNDNSDAERFKKEIQALAGAPVYIAE